MLDKIDFYPGNFSAQYGRAMGGIVDVGARRSEERQDPRARAGRPHRRAGDGAGADRRRLDVRRRGAALVVRRLAGAGPAGHRRRRHRGARLLRLPGDPREEVEQGEGDVPRRLLRLRRPGLDPHQRRERERPGAHRRHQLAPGVSGAGRSSTATSSRATSSSAPTSPRGRTTRPSPSRTSTSTSPSGRSRPGSSSPQKISRDATIDFGLDAVYTPYAVSAQLPPPLRPGSPPPARSSASPPSRRT